MCAVVDAFTLHVAGATGHAIERLEDGLKARFVEVGIRKSLPRVEADLVRGCRQMVVSEVLHHVTEDDGMHPINGRDVVPAIVIFPEPCRTLLPVGKPLVSPRRTDKQPCFIPSTLCFTVRFGTTHHQRRLGLQSQASHSRYVIRYRGPLCPCRWCRFAGESCARCETRQNQDGKQRFTEIELTGVLLCDANHRGCSVSMSLEPPPNPSRSSQATSRLQLQAPRYTGT